MNIAKYAKAWTVLSAGVLGWGAQVVASSSGTITSPEWLGLATVVVATVGCFFMPNTNTPPPAA